MNHLKRIVLVTFACFGIAAAFAQSTTLVMDPVSCSTYSDGYTNSCRVPVETPSGTMLISYAPLFQGHLDVIQFGSLNNLGNAKVQTVTTSPLTTITESGVSNQPYYFKMAFGTQKTTFMQEPYDALWNTCPFVGYTGSSSIMFTVTTRCCSSGRGPHQASTWVINSGSVTINQ